MVPVIKELSKSMINKIAAGEVVERPANIVKELVENSIDAGATKIVIEIENGGMGSIKISDNGCGIPGDQILLALSPHSTSKLSEPDDLFRIHTLGFRGEALASIAEITHLTLSSRAEGHSGGHRIQCGGGERGEILMIGRDVGTTIEARDIFFNVPARRKFLKSVTAEFGHIQEAVVRLAIPNMNVAFVLKHNGRLIYDLPANEGEIDRLRRLFKDETASRLVPIESTYKEIGIRGYVGKPELFRSTSKMQYLFLNKRYIRDQSLFHAVREAYRGLIENAFSSRYPVVFLNLTVPVNFVDFNVHPTKMEVRFVDSQGIYAGLLGAIRELFLNTNLTERMTNEEVATAAKRSSEQRTGMAIDRGRAADTADIPDARREEFQRLTIPNSPDPNDPAGAMDLSAIERKRRETGGWSRPDQSRNTPAIPDQARFDIDAANAALAEAAALDAEERNAYAAPKPSNNAEFKKYPPLPAAADARSSAPALKLRNIEEIRRGAAELAAGRSSSPQEDPSIVVEQPAAPAPPEPKQDAAVTETETAAENAPKEAPAPQNNEEVEVKPLPKQDQPEAKPVSESELQDKTLLDRVAANNAHLLEGKELWTKRVAFDSHGRPVVQMCRRYLVMEAPDGVALIDQHALHERIMFERVKANIESGELDVQRLLIPEVVDLPPTDLALALESKELFANLGVIFEEFGGTSVVINGYPSIMGYLSPREIFTSILEAIRERRGGAVSRAEMLDFAIKQTACKAAIKAGENASPEAVTRLIAEAEKEVYFHHCPHGRPSTVVLTCDQIDKFFKR